MAAHVIVMFSTFSLFKRNRQATWVTHTVANSALSSNNRTPFGVSDSELRNKEGWFFKLDFSSVCGLFFSHVNVRHVLCIYVFLSDSHNTTPSTNQQFTWYRIHMHRNRSESGTARGTKGRKRCRRPRAGVEFCGGGSQPHTHQL